MNIVNSLLGKLVSYGYEEACRSYHVYEDLQGLKDTLPIVSGVLLDAERKDQKYGVCEWLRQIQNICHDAEDVLDEFELKNKQNQVVEASGRTLKKVRQFFSSNPLVIRRKMAHKIKEIRDRLDNVAADGERFGLISVDHRLVLQQREMMYPNIGASSVIGRENEQDEIINLLMQPHPQRDGDVDKSLCVIPIVGIGGLGKTTLAKSVFNDMRMDRLFQLKMWVCVSHDFDLRNIIIKIINSATASIFTSSSSPSSGISLEPLSVLTQLENINNFDIVQLVSLLSQILSGQKFLVVLDDVWNDDLIKWLELKDLIRVCAPVSKIMVTTRSRSIAKMVGDVPSYVLKGLSPRIVYLCLSNGHSRKAKKKNSNSTRDRKRNCEKMSRSSISRENIRSSLFSNFEIRKWEFVRDSEIWNLEQKEVGILVMTKSEITKFHLQTLIVESFVAQWVQEARKFAYRTREVNQPSMSNCNHKTI